MTEAEWLACMDPKLLLIALQGKASDRKMRLCACAIVRRQPGYTSDELRQRGVELAERVADGLATEEEREDMREELQVRKENEVAQGEFDRAFATRNAQYCLDRNQRYFFWFDPGHRVLPPEDALVVRDIFGNPFRPVAFSRSWRTDTVLTLAAQMYESRDFGAMPILADALQDAGCDNADVLDHCRDPKGVHVRGCWVVDSVLGKE
ncbi:hypothetical protein R5W23_003590 [Gemmata sp. JC673]|uniref:SMI1/KNR4 family protein n=1 Tax=Gemmata algarum TaxID=2975278 RepID=A0ABU5F4M6_9BACT|nr:hypothetical protein [Gemmata algarum]MDY3562144.1 hypothetical protein [Gemmata algarum]